MTLTLRQRFTASLIAAVAYPLLVGLFRTYRWKVDGAEHYERVLASGKQPILALWHGRILPATLFWRDRGIVALTSENFDGEWTAKLMQKFGYRSVRGSSTRGGVRALVQMQRTLRAGQPAAVTVDGPRGPERVVKPGIVWLARVTGNPILPFHIEASRYWTLRSWDRAQIPKPFSTLSVAVGSPMIVSSAKGAPLDGPVGELAQMLGDLEVRAARMLH